MECPNCKKPKKDFNGLQVELQFKMISELCETCKEYHTERYWLDFCSPECLVEYVKNTGLVDEISRFNNHDL